MIYVAITACFFLVILETADLRAVSFHLNSFLISFDLHIFYLFIADEVPVLLIGRIKCMVLGFGVDQPDYVIMLYAISCLTDLLMKILLISLYDAFLQINLLFLRKLNHQVLFLDNSLK